MKFIIIKLKKKLDRAYSYIRNVVELMNPPQFGSRIADSPTI